MLPSAVCSAEASGPLVHSDAGPQLVGSRCASCGARAFPARSICHVCATMGPEAGPLGSGGTLYSWTTVFVSSTRETPYDLGYVDLTDPEGAGVRVLAPLVGGTGWSVGQPVQLVEDAGSPESWAFTGGSAA